jgi:hypothetical protein
MEMAGQEYGTLFNFEKGLLVNFLLWRKIWQYSKTSLHNNWSWRLGEKATICGTEKKYIIFRRKVFPFYTLARRLRFV